MCSVPHYITLLGAEQVERAAGTMRDAAHQMQRAADNMEGVFNRHQQFMEEWLQRYEALLERRPDGTG